MECYTHLIPKQCVLITVFVCALGVVCLNGRVCVYSSGVYVF